MADLEHLFKTFELTNNEFYKNGDNRWKFFRVFGATLSALIIASYKLPDLRLPLLLLSSIISLGGILVLVSVYRIIVSIDIILTGLQRAVLLEIFEGNVNKVSLLLYPEATQFLRGSAYVFSIHNAMTAIAIGFFAFSTCELYFRYCRISIVWVVLLGIAEMVLLFSITYYFSNKPYETEAFRGDGAGVSSVVGDSNSTQP